MIQAHPWLQITLPSRRIADLIATQCFGDLLSKSLLLAEAGEEWFVEQVLDVLGVVEGGAGCRRLGGALLAARLSRVDALEDT